MDSSDRSATTIEELRDSLLNDQPRISWPRDHESRLQAIEAKLGIKPPLDPHQASESKHVDPDFGPYSRFHNAILKLIRTAQGDGVSDAAIVARLLVEAYRLDPLLAEKSREHEKAMYGVV
jgi:hypothetical protein